MKPFIIFGKGDFADIVEYIIVQEMHGVVAGYTVNECYLNTSRHKDKPVIALEHIEEYFEPDEYNVTIAYEAHDMYVARSSIIEELKRKNFSFENVVSISANTTNAVIGEANIIMQNVFIGPFAKIGNGNVFWATSQVQHHNVVGNYNCFAPGFVSCGYSVIPNHCFFGANSTVKNGIKISNKTFVGANAYLDRNTEENSVWLPSRAIMIFNNGGFFNMSGFSEGVKRKAFNRAKGRCEGCGKLLSYDNHEEGQRGAWEAHHKKAIKDGGDNTLSNCKVLCLDCHKNTATYGQH